MANVRQTKKSTVNAISRSRISGVSAFFIISLISCLIVVIYSVDTDKIIRMLVEKSFMRYFFLITILIGTPVNGQLARICRSR